jgi:hypothetical protein
VIKRFLFVLFFICGGFLFYIPKWIFFGTAAGRERKRLLKEQKKTNRLLAKQAQTLSEDGMWRWDGQQWIPTR